MDEITVALAALNPPALDAALRAALGDLIAGVSAAHGEVRVHFTRRASASEAELARQIVERHDPAELSTEQRATRAYAQRLALLESEVTALDLSAPLNGPALEKAVRWLLLRQTGAARPETEKEALFG